MNTELTTLILEDTGLGCIQFWIIKYWDHEFISDRFVPASFCVLGTQEARHMIDDYKNSISCSGKDFESLYKRRPWLKLSYKAKQRFITDMAIQE